MEKTITQTCPICGGAKLIYYTTCKDSFTSGEEFDLYQCEKCQFLQTTNIPSKDDLGKYYQSDAYISHSNTKKGLINKVYHTVREYMLNRKANLVEEYSNIKNGALLDVGTGIGLFPKKMIEKQWDVEAIETSADARSFAKDNFNITLHDENYWSTLLPESKDVITLWHVLEHIPELNAIWDRFHTILKQKGTLIIAVPNCSSFDAQYYHKDWAAFDVPRHLWHFTPESMKQIAKKHKFQVVKELTMPFDGFYISMISEKNRDSSFSFIKGFWIGLKGWIKSWKRQSESSSIIYILKKID